MSKNTNLKEGKKSIKVACLNKQAGRDYEILDTYEAGIVLLGSEVKSIRQGGMSLKESYVTIKNSECFLIGSHITPYKWAHNTEQEPDREKKLLLNRKEIIKLAVQIKQKGLTLIPYRCYFNESGRCKIEIAVGRGKKLYDKRENVKKREALIEMERAKKNKIRR